MEQEEKTYRLVGKYAVVGLMSKGGKIVDCAPYARKKSLGKPTDEVLNYWRGKGFTVEELEES